MKKTESEREFTLRWAGEFHDNDAVQIIDLMNSVIEQETIIGYVSPIDYESGRQIVAELGQDVAKSNCHVLLGLDRNQKIVGMVIFRQNKQPNCKHLAELSKGIIHPSARSRGLLQIALAEIARKCQELGVDILTLDVRAGTRSEKIWRAVGFKPYGTLEDYARVNQEVHAGIFMYQYVRDLSKNLLM